MTIATSAKPPASFWIISGLSLLWNAFGGYLYIMTQRRDPSVMEGTPDAVLRGLETMPVWAVSAYAVGVWASLIGSALLVLRLRHAGNVFLVSLIGAVVSFGYQYGAGMVPSPAVPTVIIAIVLFLLWYSKRAAEQGILK